MPVTGTVNGKGYSGYRHTEPRQLAAEQQKLRVAKGCKASPGATGT